MLEFFSLSKRDEGFFLGGQVWGKFVETRTRRLVVAMPWVLPGGKVRRIEVSSSQPVRGYFVIELATVGALRLSAGWMWYKNW